MFFPTIRQGPNHCRLGRNSCRVFPQTVYFPKQVPVRFSLRKKGWPRYALAASPELVRPVSAMCSPCVRLVSPNFVRHVLAMGPPCVHFGRASNLVCHVCALHFVRHHVSAKALALLWALPALGLLYGRAVTSSGEILSHHCATHRVYIAYPRVSFLHIVWPAPA